jgi:hypothetical protein
VTLSSASSSSSRSHTGGSGGGGGRRHDSGRLGAAWNGVRGSACLRESLRKLCVLEFALLVRALCFRGIPLPPRLLDPCLKALFSSYFLRIFLETSFLLKNFKTGHV